MVASGKKKIIVLKVLKAKVCSREVMQSRLIFSSSAKKGLSRKVRFSRRSLLATRNPSTSMAIEINKVISQISARIQCRGKSRKWKSSIKS